MNCPKCKTPLNIGELLRQNPPTQAQKDASKRNGAKGGRPKKDKTK